MKATHPSPIERAALIATSQHGIIYAEQIRELGLPVRTVRRLVATRQLETLYPNVYRFNGNPIDWPARMFGAIVWGGERAVASLRAAARINGLSIKSEVVEITIPRKIRPPAGIVSHYGFIDPVDVRRIEGIPVTSVPRTLLTLGSVVPSTLVERLLDESLISGKAKIRGLVDVLLREGKRGMPGVATFRRLLDQRIAVPEQIRSELERQMNQIFKYEKLPPAIPQYKILLGERRLYPDFAYPELKIAIECVSKQFHSSRQQIEADIERENLLLLNGWLVLKFTWLMVTRQPKMVAEDIRAALAARSL